MKVGCIGLGIMGKPCAINLIKAGFEVLVWARRPERVEGLIQAGALHVDSIATLAAQVDVVVTNLSDTPDVREVLLGPGGVSSSGRAGLICIDMSTISPAAVREMAQSLSERSIELLDCPVSGGEVGAIAGTLTIMAGGREDVFERVLPVLAAMGKTITRIGDSGAGQVAKACNQIVVGVTIAGVAEALGLASRLGVDAARVREALLGGFAASRVLEVHGRRMLDQDYTPGFKAALHAKDLGIVLENAEKADMSLPFVRKVSELLGAALVHGEGDLDSSVIARQIQRGGLREL